MIENNRCALYIRVSTDDQTEYSPDSQIKLCKKYAQEHDLEVLSEHIYQEDGISGTKAEKRPQFLKMIANAKSKPKPFDIILVYDFSRFARNKEESVMYKTLLRKKLDINVVSITQPLSSGKESVILESMYEAMDEYYSLNLAENSLRGKIEKASRGEHQGNPPYGYIYNKNNKMIEVDEPKAEIVKFIFNEWIKPENNIRTIVIKLNDLGIKTTRGCMWADRSLHIILRNPAYIGYSRFTVGGMKRNWHDPNTKVVKGKHKPIIDNDTWNKAQIKMKLHDDTWFRYKKPQVKHEHWLRGIIKCSDCGKTMVKVKVKSKPHTYFQCTGFTKGRCKHSHYIREDVLVPAILNQIKNTFKKKINIEIISREDSENNEITLLKNQLNKYIQKLKRIELAYQDGIDTLEEYKIKKINIKSEIDKFEKEIKILNSKEKLKERRENIYKLCKTAYEILSNPNENEIIKSDISHKLFDNITYNKKEEKLYIKYKEIN